KAHMTVNRFAHITNSREEGMRYAENARYQTRLASSLRNRQEGMDGIALVDVPAKSEDSLEAIYDNLPIGDVDTVAEKLVKEIAAAKPTQLVFWFKAGNPPHKSPMRSMELMIGEVKPRIEKALGLGESRSNGVPFAPARSGHSGGSPGLPTPLTPPGPRFPVVHPR